MSIKTIKDSVKAEIKKEATKIKKAVADVKAGVDGAKDKANNLATDLAKNTVVAPLIPMIPAMLYLLKKEKNITFSAKDIATKRYKIVESFYNNIVLPYAKKNNLESFDMVEMSMSDLENAEEALVDSGAEAVADITSPTGVDSDSAISQLFSSAVEGGTKGAKLGASAGTALVALGVPPPISNLAGAGAGAQLGVIVSSVLRFFKLGIAKVKEALDKTKGQVDDLSAGLPILPEEVPTASTFDYKKLLIPVVALVAIYFLVIKKN